MLIKQVKVKLTCVNCHIRTTLILCFVYNGDKGGRLFFFRQRYASKTSLRAVVIATVAFLAHTFCKVLFIRVFTVNDFFLSFIIFEIASPTHALRKRRLLFMRANLVELKLSDRLLVTSVVTSLAQPFGVDRFFFMGTLSRNVPTVKL